MPSKKNNKNIFFGWEIIFIQNCVSLCGTYLYLVLFFFIYKKKHDVGNSQFSPHSLFHCWHSCRPFNLYALSNAHSLRVTAGGENRFADFCGNENLITMKSINFYIFDYLVKIREIYLKKKHTKINEFLPVSWEGIRSFGSLIFIVQLKRLECVCQV